MKLNGFLRVSTVVGFALLVGSCGKQQSPLSVQSNGENTIGTSVGVISEMQCVTHPTTGRLFLIMKNTSNAVYYRYQNSNGTWPTSWTFTGHYSISYNIATLSITAGSSAGAWIFFEEDANHFVNMKCPTNSSTFQNTGTYYPWPVNGEITAVKAQTGAPLVLGRTTDTRGVTNQLCAWYNGAYSSISSTAIGNFIAVDTLSSPYGTNGIIKVFVTPALSGSNILTLQQLTPYTSSKLGTWQATYTDFGITCWKNIAIGKNQAGYEEVFLSNTGSYIYHNYQTSSTTWSGWFQLTPSPSTYGIWDMIRVGANASGRLELFWGNFNYNDIQHQWQITPNSAWDTPALLMGSNGIDLKGSGMYYMGVTVGRTGLGSQSKLNVFMTTSESSDNTIYFINQIAPDGTWSNWAGMN